MTIANEPYIRKAVQGALDDFADRAGPGNTNDLFYALACRLLELAHAAPDVYSAADAERDACGAARAKGHDEVSIAATWRSAERTTAGKAAHVPAPTYQNGAAPSRGGYADLVAYAQSRGVPAEAFERAGWSDATLWEYAYQDKAGKPALGLDDDERLTYTRTRRALRIDTDAGPRYRLIDEDKPKPKYWHRLHTHTDATKAWYRLGDALAIAARVGYLALVNGEASVVAAQHWGVPALCETGGGEKTTPDHLLQLLRAVWPGPIVIALDCDGKGQKAAAKKVAQYRAAGWADARAVDLNLGAGEDVADFCRLHGADSARRLPALADLAGTAPVAPASGQQPAPRTPSQVIIDELARLGYTFRLNLCTDDVEVNGRALDDITAAEMRTALRDLGWKRFGAVEDAYTAHAASQAYHPVRDYLLGLAWDGVSRFGDLASCLVSDDPPVVYADGSAVTLAGVYLTRWLIGAVAKALDAHQNGMLVLSGPQNLGKSHFARWLCPLPAYHLESPINLGDKDSLVRLMRTWIWEVSELDATTRKADVSALKHFITQQIVAVRKSYGRYDTTKPALASLIGTVNDGSGFLADETGNRRFYVLSLRDLDWGYAQIDVAQLWAEAVARYRAGEPWRLLPEESAHQARQNQQYMTDSVLVDWIRKYCHITQDPDHAMTAADVVDTLRGKDVKLHGSDRALAMEISAAMAKLGVRKVKTGGQRVYVGVMPKL